MTAILVITGVALLALPGIVASRAARLRPDEWRWLNLAASGLVRDGGPRPRRRRRAVGLGRNWCRRGGRGLPPPAGTSRSRRVLAGAASLAMSVAFVAVTCSARWRSRRLQRSARIETCVGEHRCLADATLVVLPTDAVVAYAALGAPPQVVVSRAGRGAHVRRARRRGPARADPPQERAPSRSRPGRRRRRHPRLAPGPRASTAAPGSASSARPTRWRPISRERGCHSPRAFKTTETILGPVPAFAAAFSLLARLEALETPAPDPTLRQRLLALAPLPASPWSPRSGFSPARCSPITAPPPAGRLVR